VPDCPDWIDELAKAHWREVVPQLHAMGVLTRIDEDALAAYCQAYARWRRAEEFIQRNGDVFTTKGDDGKIKYVQQWPQVSIARHVQMTMLRLQQEFGLTPASRSRIGVMAGAEQDEFEEFLRKPKIVGA
jgi:P27 family predicted phage terminase small subunit